MDLISAQVDKYLEANPATSLSTCDAVDAVFMAILRELPLSSSSPNQSETNNPLPSIEINTNTADTSVAPALTSTSTPHPAHESPTTSPRNSALLPPGTEWKALTIYQTLQDHDHTNHLQKTRHLNSLQLSKELAQQISVKNAQARRERDEDHRYFSDVILKDIQKYHRECDEKEEMKRRANEAHRGLLRKQKQSEAKRRNIDEREAARVQIQRDRERFEAEEKAQQEKKRMMQLKYRSELLQQIKEQQRHQQSRWSGRDDVMTKTERSMNRSDLEMLKDDPVKYQKVKKILLENHSPPIDIATPPASAAAPATSAPSAATSSPVKRGRRLKGWEGVE
jgi:hypothetical protein